MSSHKKWERLGFAGCIAAALLAASGWVRAEELQGTLKQIVDNRVIRLGFHKETPPFSFIGADGKPKGYSVDLCYRIVAGIRNEYGLSIDIQWVELNSQTRFQRVADGSVDLECGASAITLSRLKLVDFSAMIWIDSKTFLVKRDGPINTRGDLAGRKVAVVKGTTTENVLREVLLTQTLGGRAVSTQLVLVNDRPAALQALLQGEVDAISADRMILTALARTAPKPEELALTDYQYGYEPYGLSLRRNDADFRYAVNKVLANLYRAGEVRELYTRWFKDLGPPPPLLDSLYDLNGLRN